jgi:hypothetical protein
MNGIDISKLVKRQQPRRHARPARKDDERQAVAQDECTPDALEDGWREGPVGVADVGDGSGDMDHGVGSG